MSNPPAKTSPRFQKFLNIALMAINFWMVLLLSIMIMSRDKFADISGILLSTNDSLMSSALLDFLLHKGFLLLLILIVLFTIVKEYKIKPIKKRLYWNLWVLAGLTAYFGLLVCLVYGPIFRAAG